MNKIAAKIDSFNFDPNEPGSTSDVSHEVQQFATSFLDQVRKTLADASETPYVSSFEYLQSLKLQLVELAGDADQDVQSGTVSKEVSEVVYTFLDALIDRLYEQKKSPEGRKEVSQLADFLEDKLFTVSPSLINQMRVEQQILTTAKLRRISEFNRLAESTTLELSYEFSFSHSITPDVLVSLAQKLSIADRLGYIETLIGISNGAVGGAESGVHAFEKIRATFIALEDTAQNVFEAASARMARTLIDRYASVALGEPNLFDERTIDAVPQVSRAMFDASEDILRQYAIDEREMQHGAIATNVSSDYIGILDQRGRLQQLADVSRVPNASTEATTGTSLHRLRTYLGIAEQVHRMLRSQSEDLPPDPNLARFIQQRVKERRIPNVRQLLYAYEEDRDLLIDVDTRFEQLYRYADQQRLAEHEIDLYEEQADIAAAEAELAVLKAYIQNMRTALMSAEIDDKDILTRGFVVAEAQGNLQWMVQLAQEVDMALFDSEHGITAPYMLDRLDTVHTDPVSTVRPKFDDVVAEIQSIRMQRDAEKQAHTFITTKDEEQLLEQVATDTAWTTRLVQRLQERIALKEKLLPDLSLMPVEEVISKPELRPVVSDNPRAYEGFLYEEMQKPYIRAMIERDLGLQYDALSLREQLQLLQLLAECDTEMYERITDIFQKEGIDVVALTAILFSTAINGQSRDTLLTQIEQLPTEYLNQIGAAYGSAISVLDRLRDDIASFYKKSEQSAHLDVRTVVIRMIERWNSTLTDLFEHPETDTPPDTLFTPEATFFVAMFKTAFESDTPPTFEELQGVSFEKLPCQTWSEKDKDVMYGIALQNWGKRGEVGEAVISKTLAFLENDVDTTYYVLRKDGEIISYIRFTPPDEKGHKKATSLNVSPLHHGGKIGEAFTLATLKKESEQYIIEGTGVPTDSVNSMYIEKSNFILVGFKGKLQDATVLYDIRAHEAYNTLFVSRAYEQETCIQQAVPLEQISSVLSAHPEIVYVRIDDVRTNRSQMLACIDGLLAKKYVGTRMFVDSVNPDTHYYVFEQDKRIATN